jgi:hypothetical protein
VFGGRKITEDAEGVLEKEEMMPPMGNSLKRKKEKATFGVHPFRRMTNGTQPAGGSEPRQIHVTYKVKQKDFIL